MAMRLYEIAEEYKFLLSNMIDEETGEVDEKMLERLNELTDPIQTKCINITRVFKSLEAEADAIEKERKAMAAREKALKSEITRLKDYLLDNMVKTEISEIKCPQFVIKIRKNPPSANVYDESLIPEEYKKVIVTYNIQAIKDAMKKGIDVPGANLVQGVSINIK